MALMERNGVHLWGCRFVESFSFVLKKLYSQRCRRVSKL